MTPPQGVARTWSREFGESAPASIRLDRIAVPVTIMHGEVDGIVPPRVAEALHQRIRGSVLVRVGGAGHMLPNTHPATVAGEVVKLAVR